MKKIPTTISILLLVLGLKAQNNPQLIEFTNVQPDWILITVDTNFVPSPLDRFPTKYYNRVINDIKLSGNNLIIQESSFSKSPAFGASGALIHSVNRETGTLNWTHHWNEYTGLKNREDYKGFELVTAGEDVSLILGSCRDNDTTSFNQDAFSFYCQPSIRKINLNDGSLISHQYNNEDSILKGIGGVLWSKVALNKNKERFFTVKGQDLETDTVIINKITIMPLDDDNHFEPEFVFEYKYKTTVPSSLAGQNFVPFLFQADPNTLVLFFGDNEINDFVNSPKSLRVVWVDISDKYNIRIKAEKEVKDLLYFPQANSAHHTYNFFGFDSGFILGQPLPDENGKRFTYLRWFDSDGNLKASIDKLLIGNEQFLTVMPIKVYNGKLYLVTVIALSQTPLKYSLISVDEDGVLTKVKDLDYKIPQGYRKVELTNLAEMDEDGNIYLCFLCNERSSDGIDYYYIQYVKFDGEKLGITTNTTDIQLSDLTLVPNPASNMIQLKALNDAAGQINIYTMLGENIRAFPYHTGDDIDVTDIPNGLYLLKFTQKSNLGLQNSIFKFVKE